MQVTVVFKTIQGGICPAREQRCLCSGRADAILISSNSKASWTSWTILYSLILFCKGLVELCVNWFGIDLALDVVQLWVQSQKEAKAMLFFAVGSLVATAWEGPNELGTSWSHKRDQLGKLSQKEPNPTLQSKSVWRAHVQSFCCRHPPPEKTGLIPAGWTLSAADTFSRRRRRTWGSS